jgi:hypothetical protein
MNLFSLPPLSGFQGTGSKRPRRTAGALTFTIDEHTQSAEEREREKKKGGTSNQKRRKGKG